jgi:hypothetical protein
MKGSLSLSYVAYWFNHRQTARANGKAKQHFPASRLSLPMVSLIVGLLFSACSSLIGGPATTATPVGQALSNIRWCGKPLMIFHDEGAVTPTRTTTTGTPTPGATSTPVVGSDTVQTISDWSTVKTNLGFTVYLPATLPSGSCLVSAQATIHDPIFGGSFLIGYLLPNHSSLSISEAPLKTQSSAFECSATSTTPTASAGKTATPALSTPGLLCLGAKNTTSIVISEPGTSSQLQQIFTGLQANVNWIPAA